MMKKGLSSGSGVSGDPFEGRNVHLEGAGGGGIRSPAAGKKVRGAAQGFGPPPASPAAAKCQVEGCNLDLKGAKSYYCRHKVCGMHSKSPKVIVAGLEQRFCQQCSRFHLLKEFDQGKRSCRRRLAGHNERRRKPPPPELLPSRFNRLLPSFPENKSGARRGYLLDFIQPRPPEPPRENVLWPSLRNDDIYSDEGIIGVSDSTCALSLLSSQLFDTVTDSTPSLAHIDPLPHVIPPSINVETARPNTGINYLNLSRGFDDHQVGSSSFYGVGSRQSHDDGDEQLPSNDVGPIEVYDYLHDFHWLL